MLVGESATGGEIGGKYALLAYHVGIDVPSGASPVVADGPAEFEPRGETHGTLNFPAHAADVARILDGWAHAL